MGKKATRKNRRSFFDPHPSGALGRIFRYWQDRERDLYGPAMTAMLKRLVKIRAIELDRELPRGWQLQAINFDYWIKTPDGDATSAAEWQFRVLKRTRALPVDPAPPSKPPQPASAPVQHDDASDAPAPSTREPKRKSHWDEPVDRVLKENFPDNDAKNLDAGDVVDKVLEVLDPEIRKSGRKPPSRALILRKSGHWKSKT